MAKERKSKTQAVRKAKSANPYFNGIREGLLDVVNSLEKGKPLTCRQISLPEPPAEMKAKEIISLLKNQLKLSQHLFAILLDVSPKTVQAWEQFVNTPSGAALRLLWLVKERPDIFRSIFSGFTAASTRHY